MPNWMRNAGKIMCAGDSITVGFLGLTGGWRKKLFEDLAFLGVRFSAVGQYTTNSPDMDQPAHQGLSGDRASVAKISIGGEIASQDPNLIIWGYGMNDLGNGATPAAYLDDLDACIDAGQTNGFAVNIVQTLILPTSANAGYYANIANYNTAQAALPARVTSQGATLCNVGTPALSDGVHPSDGASGYDLIADAIKTTLLATIP